MQTAGSGIFTAVMTRLIERLLQSVVTLCESCGMHNCSTSAACKKKLSSTLDRLVGSDLDQMLILGHDPLQMSMRHQRSTDRVCRDF